MLAAHVLSIVRGEGLVARFGDVAMFIAEPTARTEGLVAAAESASRAEDAGAVIARRLAAVAFAQDAPEAVAFGVVAPTTDGLLVLLRGNVSAEIVTAQGARTLTGERAVTWVDEVVHTPVLRLAITAADGPARSASPLTDLRAGVVPGAGFVLHSPVNRPGEPDPGRTGAALPGPTAGPDTVAGTDPTLLAQPATAAAPAHGLETEMAAHVTAPGFLRSGDGAAYPLDRDYVIGRDPQRDDAVRRAAATAIVIRDDRHVSRVHAHLTIEGATVLVRDAGTPAGTFKAAPGSTDWARITSTPTELEPGWSLRVGEEILTYHLRE